MILICTVLLAAFGFIYFSTAKELEENSISAMKDIAVSKNGPLDFFFEPDKKNDSKYSYLSTYIIELDTETNTCYIEGFGDVDNLSEEQIKYVNNLIHSVGNQNSPEGILEDYNMRYYCVNIPRGMRIVLLDKRYEDDSLQQLLISFLIIGITNNF